MAAAKKTTAKETPVVEKEVEVTASEEVKEEPAKKETAKAEPAKKETRTAKKTTAKEEPEKKETAKAEPAKKETKTTKKTTKKTTRKTNAKKAAETVTEAVADTVKAAVTRKPAAAKNAGLFVEFDGRQINKDELIDQIIEKWCADEGKKPSAIKELNIYIKPEDNAAYYVINGQGSSIGL